MWNLGPGTCFGSVLNYFTGAATLCGEGAALLVPWNQRGGSSPECSESLRLIASERSRYNPKLWYELFKRRRLDAADLFFVVGVFLSWSTLKLMLYIYIEVYCLVENITSCFFRTETCDLALSWRSQPSWCQINLRRVQSPIFKAYTAQQLVLSLRVC